MNQREALAECLQLEAQNTKKNLTFSIAGNGEEYLRSRVILPELPNGTYVWTLTAGNDTLFQSKVKMEAAEKIPEKKDEKKPTDPAVSIMLEDMREEMKRLRERDERREKAASDQKETFYDKMLENSDNRLKSFFEMQKTNHEFLMQAQRDLGEYYRKESGGGSGESSETILAKALADTAPELIGLFRELRLAKLKEGGGGLF